MIPSIEIKAGQDQISAYMKRSNANQVLVAKRLGRTRAMIQRFINKPHEIDDSVVSAILLQIKTLQTPIEIDWNPKPYEVTDKVTAAQEIMKATAAAFSDSIDPNTEEGLKKLSGLVAMTNHADEEVCLRASIATLLATFGIIERAEYHKMGDEGVSLLVQWVDQLHTQGLGRAEKIIDQCRVNGYHAYARARIGILSGETINEWVEILISLVGKPQTIANGFVHNACQIADKLIAIGAEDAISLARSIATQLKKQPAGFLKEFFLERAYPHLGPVLEQCSPELNQSPMAAAV